MKLTNFDLLEAVKDINKICFRNNEYKKIIKLSLHTEYCIFPLLVEFEEIEFDRYYTLAGLVRPNENNDLDLVLISENPK